MNENFGIPPGGPPSDLMGMAAQPARGREGTGGANAQGFPNKYVEILVFKGSQSQDLSYVPVGVNGYAWKIARGEKVIVNVVVAHALNDAVEDVTTKSEGGLETRPAHRFPFQIVRDNVPEAEYLQFRDQCRAMGAKAAVV